MDHPPARVEVRRGGHVEAVHRVHVAVCDSAGALVAVAGDPNRLVGMRSAAKPFQAAGLVSCAGGFGFGSPELALACASHNAEERHVELALSMLSRLGLTIEHLQCAAHGPIHNETRDRGGPFTAVHNNCSGKHIGMLARCIHNAWDLPSYLDKEHPLQLEIARSLETWSDSPLGVAVDGCGVPAFYLPLAAAARAWARLALGDGDLALIASAMMDNPYLVAGEDRFCTRLMEALPGRVVTKYGAEGIQGIGLPEAGLGLVVKVEDGRERAIEPVVYHLLQALDLKGIGAIDAFAEPVVLNVAGREVGNLRAAVDLHFIT